MVAAKSAALVGAMIVSLSASQPAATPRTLEAGAFEFDMAVTVPGAPEQVFDLFTGDISGWWDHSFSSRPSQLVLEPVVGGGFWEFFDEEGNGVKHAEVTYVARGELLRFEGALGLSGNAIRMVHTVAFAPGPEGDSDSTTVSLTVRGAGQLEPGWPETVESVWRHFLVERFKRYVENGGMPLGE